MRFLRENRILAISLIILPVFFFYLDAVFMSFLKAHYIRNSPVHRFLFTIDPVMGFFSHGGTLIAIVCILLLAGRFYPRIRGVGKALLFGFIFSGILAQVLKHLVGRARPRLTDHLMVVGPTLKSGFDSFPSGHTMVAFCFAEILASHFPRYRAFFYVWAAFTGLERMEDMAHFPSDVLAGAILGIMSARWLSAKVIPRSSFGAGAYLPKQAEGESTREKRS